MKQVLRFNKVIKRIVFTGDLILLNGTFLSLYTLLGSKFFADPFIHSLPQVLVLLNLCYLVSNMSSGIILHRRVVRPEQIVWRALRNSAGHALFFPARSPLETSASFPPAFSYCSTLRSLCCWFVTGYCSARS